MISKPTRNKKEAEQAKPAAGQSRQRAATSSKSRGEKKSRAELLSERFHPEAVKYLNDVFGIDLADTRIPDSVVYDIAAGRVTEPIEAVVTPLTWSRSEKKAVQMPPVKVVDSFRFVLPYDPATHKPVAPSADKPVFVSTYPCYAYLQKADPSQAAERTEEAGEAKAEPVSFSDAQVQALEGIGINPDRLYANSFNAVSQEDKQAMAEGRPFELSGTVRISDGSRDSRVSVNLAGMARMVTMDDGSVKVKFEPRYPVQMRANDIVDLMGVRRIGNLELDFFERDGRGHRKSDVYGNPIINAAGRDLVRYGQAFAPVDGYIHRREFNRATGKVEESISRGKYQVSLVNGGICATAMQKVLEEDRNGIPVMIIDLAGRSVQKYHWEVAGAHIGEGGTVRVDSQVLRPASEYDLEAYRRGRGGVFKDYVFTDHATGKTEKYDAFLVPDNRRGGFARAFSKKVSAELIARREEKSAVRKQNYSFGI